MAVPQQSGFGFARGATGEKLNGDVFWCTESRLGQVFGIDSVIE